MVLSSLENDSFVIFGVMKLSSGVGILVWGRSVCVVLVGELVGGWLR